MISFILLHTQRLYSDDTLNYICVPTASDWQPINCYIFSFLPHFDFHLGSGLVISLFFLSFLRFHTSRKITAVAAAAIGWLSYIFHSTILKLFMKLTPGVLHGIGKFITIVCHCLMPFQSGNYCTQGGKHQSSGEHYFELCFVAINWLLCYIVWYLFNQVQQTPFM